MTNYYVIADTHFGDEKAVQRYNRPQNHSRVLEWNLLMLPKDSVLLHVGDICTKDDLYWHEQCIRRIRGKKILIRGNLDLKGTGWYLDHGWDAVFDHVTLSASGIVLEFSHIPRAVNPSHINIHGHMHNMDTSDTLPNNCYCVSAELLNYQPVKLSEIVFNLQDR